MGNSTLLHLEYCTYCPKMCRHTCPVSETDAREAHIPQAKMARLHDLLLGRLPWTAEQSHALWACSGCRACLTACALDVDVAPTLFAGRAEAQRAGVAPPELERFGERFRAREARLGGLRAALPAEARSNDARVVLFPGCDALDKGEAELRALLTLLGRLGAEHVRVADIAPGCGGYPLLAAGLPDAFRWHAERVTAALEPFATVLVGCSACTHALRTLYPAEGLRVRAEVLHVSEFLAQHEARLPRAPADAELPEVWLHDPCHLARWQEVMEPPRRLLARVARVREFTWSGEATECCGGAGVMPKTMPDVADGMARRRLDEVVRAGGGTVVTTCPTCRFMLARNAPPGVIVRELGELLLERALAMTGTPA
jgi:Fe-S oxidoreductase